MEELFQLAAALGVTIEYADLTHLHRDGDCNLDTKTIRLQHGMLPRLERSVLAHELAHFIRGDRRTMFGFYDARSELRADEWAAHFLLNIADYKAAEAQFGCNTEAIAEELNVMDYIVEAFERTLNRVGEYIFVNAKMGAGQWTQKVRA